MATSRKGILAPRSPCPRAELPPAECDFLPGLIHKLPVSSPWTPSSRWASPPGTPRSASASLRAGFARLPLQGGATRPPLTPPDGTMNPLGVGQVSRAGWVSFRLPFRAHRRSSDHRAGGRSGQGGWSCQLWQVGTKGAAQAEIVIYNRKNPVSQEPSKESSRERREPQPQSFLARLAVLLVWPVLAASPVFA